MQVVRAASWLALMGALAAACGGSDLLLPSAGRPAAVAIVRGNNQSARIGEPLAEPIVVRVSDASGRPVAQAAVTFAVTSGAGGALTPQGATTDTEGQASTRWSLGTAAGEYTAEARVAGGTVDPVRFTAFAAAGTPARIALVKGDQQMSPVGTALPDSLVVRATDAADNPVEGVGIAWTIGGGGSVSAEATATGPDGRAGVVRVLGPAAGAQTTVATLGGVTGASLTFIATATSGAAGKLRLVTQPSASARIGIPFARQPQVQLIDNLDNPVRQAGRAVTVAIAAGPAGATLGGQRTRETDADGLASFTDLAISGTAGSYTLSFSGADLALTTSTSITVTSGEVSPTRSAVDAEPESFLVLAEKSTLTVRLVDELGNPVGGSSVTPTVDRSEGSFQPANALTDGSGRATFALTVSRPGRYILGARAGGVTLQGRDTVNAAKLPSALAIAAVPAAPTRALQPVRFNWTVTGNALAAPTGTVTISAGGVSCSAALGQGGCSITPLIAGTLTVTGTYAGDAVYLQSSTALEHQVVPVPTQVTAFSSSSPIATEAESVTLQATVVAEAGSPAGTTLTFSRDACGPTGVVLATRTVSSSGAASWTTKNLPLGTYPIFACYNGDQTYSASQGGPVIQTVTSRR
jgi:hypothetical protein